MPRDLLKKDAWDTANMKRQRAARKAIGLCVRCGKTPARLSLVACQPCADRSADENRRRLEKRIAKGLCIHCGKSPPQPGSSTGRCRWCLCKRIAHSTFQLRGDAIKNATRLLLDIFESQRGRCAYSGLPMTLGIDAELDHIVPVSNGGTSHPSNLHWVLAVVNRMKHDIDESDFLRLAQQIAEHTSTQAPPVPRREAQRVGSLPPHPRSPLSPRKAVSMVPNKAHPRRVNAERLSPIVDPFRSRDAIEPDEDPPACPACGGETLWFIEPHTTCAELVCLDCGPETPTNDLPEADGSKDGALTTEQLKRHARAYADAHFPGWRGVAIHIRMGERDDGECGELLLVMTNAVESRSDQPEPTGNGLSVRPFPQ